MHLKQVTLNNFRCFDTLTVDLHPRLTVIVAENGGGKTSLLDGIAVGLTKVLHGLTSANQRLSGPSICDTDFRLEPHTDSKGEKNWSTSDYAQIILHTTQGLKWDHWRPSAKNKQPPVKIGLTDLNFLGQVLDSIKTATPTDLPVFAYYGTSRGQVDVPQRLRSAKSKTVNYDFPTHALWGCLDAFTDFKELLKWFDAEEASELRANKDVSGEDYCPFGTLVQIRETVNLILAGDYTNPRFNRRHKFVVTAKNGPDELQVEQLSQGYQSMLALALDFARRLATSNPHLEMGYPEDSTSLEAAYSYVRQWHPEGLEGGLLHGPAMAPAIMLIDEVDLHLHPSWQQRVLGDLMRAFPHTQFIVTTHSPQVLTTVKSENIRVLGRDADGRWQVNTPERSPLGQESSDALARIMGTHPRPELPLLEDVHTYEQFARAGLAASPEAQAALARLTAAGFQFQEADLALFAFLASKKKADEDASHA